MAAFQYIALDKSGKTTKGIIDADDAKAARALLRRDGLFPTEVKEEKSGGSTKGSGLNVEIDLSKFFQRVSTQDLAEMTSQLETLLRTSVDIAESLQILSEQSENPMLQLALVEIRDDVRRGESLSAAMAKHDKIFNSMYISLIEVGQETGQLDEILGRLRDYTRKMVALQQKIISSLSYPLLMGGISILIIIGLFVGVIPKIRTIFESFGATLPLLTRIMLGLSDFLLNYWYIPLFGSILGAYVFKRWVSSEQGRLTFDSWVIRTPVLGKLIRMIATSRFCRTLATLLRGGLPMATALPIAQNVLGNKVLEGVVQEATDSIVKGDNFSDPLLASGHFPPLIVRMIAVGERTGEMEHMLLEGAEAYDRRVETQLDSLTSVLEPAMIVIFGGFTILVALSILMPILSMAQLAR